MIRCFMTIAIFIISPLAFADYRPNHGGWAHAHDCEGSESEHCEPHHHMLRPSSIRLAVRDLIHLALVEYNQRIDLPGSMGAERYWAFRESLKESFIEYFNENPRELLLAIPKDLGNTVSGCSHSPYKNGTTDLEHTLAECNSFKTGKKEAAINRKSKEVRRPNIDDFIANFLEQRPEKI